MHTRSETSPRNGPISYQTLINTIPIDADEMRLMPPAERAKEDKEDDEDNESSKRMHGRQVCQPNTHNKLIDTSMLF